MKNEPNDKPKTTRKRKTKVDVSPAVNKNSNPVEAIKKVITPTSSLPPIIEDDSYSLKTAELDFDNEVYDEGDIASALELGFIAQALEAHKAKVAPESHPDFDGESCLDCGDTIPEVRLKMGKIRCVYCQEALEKKNKLHGK